MSSTDANPYDEIPYVGHAYNFTHPDRLSVVGVLFGMQPAPVGKCRVLELGCGDGANLLPMAACLPESRFFGIDLAAKPVEQGSGYAAELGLTNLKLQPMDIMEFPADAGEFDYIIVHGIYSWVPAFVREKILAICAAHLAPQGIAYISYKTYPGSHVSGTIHEMMRYQVSRRPGMSEEEVVHAGLNMCRFIVDSRQETDAYRAQLKWRLDAIDERMAAYGGYTWIYHDLGVAVSDPLYFYQFAEQAGRHGLQFLSEPGLEFSNPAYNAETAAALAAMDTVEREQYEDLLENREFRRTLVCRAGCALDRSFDPERVRTLHASSPIQARTPPGAPDDPMAKEAFAAPGNMTVTVDQPAVKEAFRRLGQIWPGSASFDELMAASAARAGVPGVSREKDAGHLANSLLAMFRRDLITLATSVPTQATAVSERPVASARLRQQIVHGRPILTNLRHAEMETKDVAVRKLLTLLDGTRDRTAMLRDLGAWLDENRASIPDLPTREWVQENLEMVLTGFVRQHFLEG